MRKYIALLVAIFALLTVAGCKKKGAEEPKGDVSLATKYATMELGIRSDKDMTKWVTNIQKTESVDLLSEEKYTPAKGSKKNKELTLAKVKTSDDKVGYVESRHLADAPIVFIKETKAYDRNNIASKVRNTIPRGTVGFKIGEKADWTQIHIGTLNGKWISKRWVKEGFSADSEQVMDGITLEAALNDIKNNKPDDAMKKLQELSGKSTVFGEIAKEKIAELEYTPEDDGEGDPTEGGPEGPVEEESASAPSTPDAGPQ
ncbi:MAG: lipoprotein LenA [bacterium]|nr:lipoprotein LenA [bacterium]